MFLIILDTSAILDKTVSHDEVSFKMEEKHADHRNLSSSQSHKYFTKEIPHFFFFFFFFFYRSDIFLCIYIKAV